MSDQPAVKLSATEYDGLAADAKAFYTASDDGYVLYQNPALVNALQEQKTQNATLKQQLQGMGDYDQLKSELAALKQQPTTTTPSTDDLAALKQDYDAKVEAMQAKLDDQEKRFVATAELQKAGGNELAVKYLVPEVTARLKMLNGTAVLAQADGSLSTDTISQFIGNLKKQKDHAAFFQTDAIGGSGNPAGKGTAPSTVANGVTTFTKDEYVKLMASGEFAARTKGKQWAIRD